MVCKQCGKDLAPGERVCPQCGTPVEETAPGVGPLEQVRSSPIFLAAVICMSVNVLFALFNAFGGGAGLAALVGVAISGVMLAGLWLAWCSGLDGKAHLMDTGLSLLQGVTLVQLILMAVCFGIADLAVLVVAVVGGAGGLEHALEAAGLGSGLSNVFGMGMLVVFLILAAATVVMVLYALFIWRDVKMARASQTAGRLLGKPSLYVAVVCFVFAAFSLVGLVVNTNNVILTLADIGAKVLFGLVILQLREQAA